MSKQEAKMSERARLWLVVKNGPSEDDDDRPEPRRKPCPECGVSHRKGVRCFQVPR